MARYVDGFVIPIKKKNAAKYKKMASLGCKVWMEYGALDYYECIADDMKQPWGGIPFPKLCKLKADETVVFAFIVYKSKAHRNAVNRKVHADPRMKPENYSGAMPFDMERFTMAGCKVIVQRTK
jgi:uncharacterized protein YbaA (DUF1428 family)